MENIFYAVLWKILILVFFFVKNGLLLVFFFRKKCLFLVSFLLFFIIYVSFFYQQHWVLFHAKPNSGGNLEIIFDSMDGAVVKKKFNCFQFAVLKTSRNAMSSVFKCFYFANPTHCIAKYFIWTAQAEQESDW